MATATAVLEDLPPPGLSEVVLTLSPDEALWLRTVLGQLIATGAHGWALYKALQTAHPSLRSSDKSVEREILSGDIRLATY
jgi:hypothetical protein